MTKMNKKTTDIVAYLTWAGLLIAYVLGDRKQSRFHLNQALVLSLASTLTNVVLTLLGWIPLVGGPIRFAMAAVDLFCLVCWFIGIMAAAQGEEKEVPLLGKIKLLH